MLSIHFECGLDYNGSTDRDTMNKMAEYYFHRFMSDFRDFSWCDVIVYEASKPHKDIGACRNPPPLPHNTHICKNCVYADTFKMNDEIRYVCCNLDMPTGGKYVSPDGTCEEWEFDESIY